jgi:hypothetical protein
MHALDSDDEELQPRLLHAKACGTWHSLQTHMHAKLTCGLTVERGAKEKER